MQRTGRTVLSAAMVIGSVVLVWILLRAGLKAYWDSDREARDGACIGCGLLLMLSVPVTAAGAAAIAKRLFWRT